MLNLLNLLKQYYLPLVVAALAAVVAARELSLDSSAVRIEDSMSLPTDADMRVALWPEDANSYHIRNIRARFFRFDLQEAREILEAGIANGWKAEEKLFFEHAYVLVLMNAPQEEIDQAVALWQRYYPLSRKTDPRLLNNFPFPGPLRAATRWAGMLSTDGRMYARALSSGDAEIWDTATGTAVTIARRSDRSVIFPLGISHSGKTLATADDGPGLNLWAIKNSDHLVELKGHTAPVYSVAFSRDGRLCASGSVDHTIRLWNVDSGEQLQVITKHDRTVSALDFSPDGSVLASGSWKGVIKLFRLSTDQTTELSGHRGAISAVTFSDDGSTVVSASRDGTIRIWDVGTGRVQQILKGTGAPIADVEVSRDGRLVVGASAGREVRIWDAVDGNLLSTNTTPAEPFAVVFSVGDRTVAVACTDHSVQRIATVTVRQ